LRANATADADSRGQSSRKRKLSSHAIEAAEEDDAINAAIKASLKDMDMAKQNQRKAETINISSGNEEEEEEEEEEDEEDEEEEVEEEEEEEEDARQFSSDSDA